MKKTVLGIGLVYFIPLFILVLLSLLGIYYFSIESLGSIEDFDPLEMHHLKHHENVSHQRPNYDQLRMLDCFQNYVEYRGGIKEIQKPLILNTFSADSEREEIPFFCDFRGGLDFEMLFSVLRVLEENSPYVNSEQFKVETLILIYWDYMTKVKLSDNFEDAYISKLTEKDKKLSFKVSNSILLQKDDDIGSCDKVCALTLKQAASYWSKLEYKYRKPFQSIQKKIPKEYQDKLFLYRYGDHTKRFYDRPVIAKALNVSERKYTTPLYLNFPRHYKELNHLAKYKSYYDKPFFEKYPVAVWRGASTGYDIGGHNSRCKLVEQYFDKKISPPQFSLENAKMVVQKVLGLYRPKSKVDICFSKLTQGAKKSKESQEYYSQFICPGKSMKEMLLYRYLISVEGNDVATGLKWMLYSNSVVFMQPPTLETRFREGSVVPWLHYIPLAEDFTDLKKKIQFCDNYVFICQKVAEMSTEFARQRIIKENEADDVNANIFKNYLDMYDINVVNKACDVEVDCVE